DPAHRHVLAGGHSGGNPHGHLLLAPHSSLTTTLLARRRDDGSFAGAVRARRDADHLTEEASLRPANFAASVTRGALGRRRAWLGAASFASIARLEQLDRHRLLGTAGDFGERHRHRNLDVGTRAWTTAATGCGTEQIAKATKSTEIAHEDAQRL